MTLALQGLESPREKLRKALWCHLDYYQRNPKVGRALFMTVPMHTWMSTETFARRDFIAMLVAVIREGQNSGTITKSIPIQTIIDLLVGALVRAFVMWQYRKEEYALTSQLEPLFRLLWGGISTSDARIYWVSVDRLLPSERAAPLTALVTSLHLLRTGEVLWIGSTSSPPR